MTATMPQLTPPADAEYIPRRRDRRLLPGAAVELNLRRANRPPDIVRGHVLRSVVARLRPNMVCYRGAVRFDSELQWLIPDRADG